MTQIEKINLLKLLYQYQAMGFTYFKEYVPLSKRNQNTYLPIDIKSLERTAHNCHLCNLAKSRNNVVFGEGNLNAKLMFIGEGPSANDDMSGKPFVGHAGNLLTTIIKKVLNLKREDVYISNIVKCRPPSNKVPDEEEVSACKPYLIQQIQTIKPDIIVTLGPTSFHYLTGDFDTPISKVHGEIFELENAKLIPTFHPSFLLRNPSSKKEVYKDMLKVKSLL